MIQWKPIGKLPASLQHGAREMLIGWAGSANIDIGRLEGGAWYGLHNVEHKNPPTHFAEINLPTADEAVEFRNSLTGETISAPRSLLEPDRRQY